MKAIVGSSRAVFAIALLGAALMGCERGGSESSYGGPAPSSGSSGTSGSGAAGGLAAPTAVKPSESAPAASSEAQGTGGAASSGTSGTGAASSAGAVIDDSIITTKVKSALLADPDIKGTDIVVDTKKGEVLLSGFVKDQVQIDKAMKVAGTIEGVKKIDSKMVIKQ
jgi:hyperosmotically inducible periplasmic protein